VKIFIVDTYYSPFLKDFVAKHSELARSSYKERHAALMGSHFAESDSYSHYLAKLGHLGVEIIANADFLQQQWARENGLREKQPFRILAEQIKLERPDVLYIQNITWLDNAQLNALREYVRLIVGQIASPLPSNLDFSGFDLILSSFPHFVRFFRNNGVPSEYFRLAFDTRVIDAAGIIHLSPSVPLTFVGGLTSRHHGGTVLLEGLAQQLPLRVWGYGGDSLAANSPLRKVFQGSAWGLEMYQVLANSRLAFNRHIDVAGRFANNLRLYEATGVGACLVTDTRENLSELFEPDREVVTYRDLEECLDKCRYLLDHEKERLAIAQAGQKRTLAEHTWAHRMQELDEILTRYLNRPSRVRTVPAKSFRIPRRSTPGAITGKWAKQLPGRRILRSLYRRLPKRALPKQEVSYGYRLIEAKEVAPALLHGWQASEIVPRQRQVVDSQLRQMYEDDVPSLFHVAAEAVRATGMPDGELIEIGCASGYYSEVLSHLLRRKVKYIGIDYSSALVAAARRFYPEIPFFVGDATSLPLASESCDVLFSGTVLLHVLDYASVVRESARVARRACIFHRTPVVSAGQTTLLSKFAYGVEVVELVFEERELLTLFEENGLKVTQATVIDTYPMHGIDGQVKMITYVCCKLQ